MIHKNEELSVITRAKECCLYVLSVTDRSPKKFRFTLVSKMQMYVLDVVENLYMANCIRIEYGICPENVQIRRKYQDQAMTKCRLLSYITMIARESGCITAKQHSIISDKTIEIQRMLYSWQQSDEKRVKQLNKE